MFFKEEMILVQHVLVGTCDTNIDGTVCSFSDEFLMTPDFMSLSSYIMNKRSIIANIDNTFFFILVILLSPVLPLYNYDNYSKPCINIRMTITQLQNNPNEEELLNTLSLLLSWVSLLNWYFKVVRSFKE